MKPIEQKMLRAIRKLNVENCAYGFLERWEALRRLSASASYVNRSAYFLPGQNDTLRRPPQTTAGVSGLSVLDDIGFTALYKYSFLSG